MIAVKTVKDQVDSSIVQFLVDFGVTVRQPRLKVLTPKEDDVVIELEAIAIEETVYQYQNKATGLIVAVIHYNTDNTALVITEREIARKYTFEMEPQIVGGIKFTVKDF